MSSLGGQTARPAFDRKAIEIAYQKFVLDNGLTLLVHTDHAKGVRELILRTVTIVDAW